MRARGTRPPRFRPKRWAERTRSKPRIRERPSFRRPTKGRARPGMGTIANLLPIADVARDLGIAAEYVEPYGRDKAKIRLDALARADRPTGKLILVSAITPTPAGEGKT